MIPRTAVAATAAGAVVLTLIAVIESPTETPSPRTAEPTETPSPTATSEHPAQLDATQPAFSEPRQEPPDPGPVPEHHGIDERDIKKVIGSSVRVHGRTVSSVPDDGNGSAREGSGFAVGDGNLVATSAHLVTDVSKPLVDLDDGRKRLPGKLVACDAANDLAVLSIDGADLNPLPLRKTEVPAETVGVLLAWDTKPAQNPLQRLHRSVSADQSASSSTTPTPQNR